MIYNCLINNNYYNIESSKKKTEVFHKQFNAVQKIK